MDTYRIDTHKLHYHVDRVARWLAGESIAPIYMEVSPSGACNHRCVFCGLDFMGYKPRFLDFHTFSERLKEMGEMGVRSIMYAGEGEPFLHRDMPEIVRRTKAAGIDAALTTNAVLMDEKRAPLVIENAEWVKVSLNAGTSDTYAHIHRTAPEDFDRVMDNLQAAVRLRRTLGSTCVLGAQCLLLPENAGEIEALAGRCRDLGLDYLVVKPYSQHPQSETRDYSDISYEQAGELAERLETYSGDGFHVVFRRQAMRRWDGKEKTYERCLALPFWSYVDAAGEVWGCSMYLGDERFRYGNLMTGSFRDIWHGPRRADSLAFCAEELDCRSCRVNCRMDPVNRYLWELRNPVPHVNFI